jgi:uncharacterized membrane protein
MSTTKTQVVLEVGVGFELSGEQMLVGEGWWS